MLLHNKVLSVVGLLSDETDPMVSVMKVRWVDPHTVHILFLPRLPLHGCTIFAKSHSKRQQSES